MARIRPGRDVIIVDRSSDGLLVESTWRFTPGLHVDLAIGEGRRRARVVRCCVWALPIDQPVRYRTALSFTDP